MLKTDLLLFYLSLILSGFQQIAVRREQIIQKIQSVSSRYFGISMNKKVIIRFPERDRIFFFGSNNWMIVFLLKLFGFSSIYLKAMLMPLVF